METKAKKLADESKTETKVEKLAVESKRVEKLAVCQQGKYKGSV